MKKIIVTLMLLVGINAIAQHRDYHKERKNDRVDMTPEQVATLHTKKMTLALDLNKGQQAQVKSLHLENAKLRKSKIEAHKAKKESEEVIKPTSDERFKMHEARLDHQIALQEQMKKILNDEQYKKWKNMRHKKGMHHMKRKMHKKTR